MEIGNPSYLWFLLLLLVPILIHLLNLRKVKKLYFSNTGLINAINQKQGKKSKWMKILVMTMRCLFLVSIVAVFLNLRKSGETGDQYQKNLIYVDNSLSMGSSADLNGNLHAVKEFIKKSLGAFPATAKFRLVTNDFFSNSNRYLSKNELLEALVKLQNSNCFRTFNEIYSRFNKEDKEVLFFSDFQKSIFSELPTIKDSITRLTAVKSVSSTASNLYIDTVYLSDAYLIDNFENNLKIKVKNDGKTAVKGIVLKVFINEVFVSTLTLDIEAKSSKEIDVTLKQRFEKFNRGKVVIEDGVAVFDDVFYFSLNKNQKLSIVEINNERLGTGTAIGNVFANDNLFDLSTFSVKNIDYAKLSLADVVMLNGLADFNDILIKRLVELREKGTIVVIVPSNRKDEDLYKKLLGRPVEFYSEKDSLFVQKLDFDFFSGVFDDTKIDYNMPYAKPLINIGGYKENILDMGFGKSMVYYLPDMKTYLFSTPLKKSATNFHQHSLFVPFMYKIAMSKRKRLEALAFRVEEISFSKRLDGQFKKQVFKLENVETASEYIPDQNVSGGRNVSFYIPKGVLGAGHYYIKSDKGVLDLIALNYEKEESLVTALSDKEVKKKLMNLGAEVSFFNVNTPLKMVSKIQEDVSGVSWWKYLVILALFFLLMEILLIRFL